MCILTLSMIWLCFRNFNDCTTSCCVNIKRYSCVVFSSCSQYGAMFSATSDRHGCRLVACICKHVSVICCELICLFVTLLLFILQWTGHSNKVLHIRAVSTAVAHVVLIVFLTAIRVLARKVTISVKFF